MKRLVFNNISYKHIKCFLFTSICLLISFAFIIAASPSVYFADTQNDYDNANKRLEELKKQQQGLSSELSGLTTQLSQSGEKIEQLDKQITDKQSELDSIQSDLDTLSGQKNEQYNAMKLRIKYMYEHNAASTLEFLVDSGSLSDFLVKTEYVQKISEYDRNMLEKFKNLIMEENTLKEQMDSDMKQLTALKDDASKEESKLKQLIYDKKNQIDISSNNINEAEQLALQCEQQLEQEKIERQRAQEAAAKEAERQAEEAARKNSQTDGSGTNNGSSDSGSAPVNTTPINYDASDLSMLAAIIECEAGNQSYEGMLAVGSVVINRVHSPRFANTISGVITAPYQFTPVMSGRFAIVLERGAKQTCVNAAQDVLNGKITINALYFHVYRGSIDDDGTVIGDHVFF